MPSDPDNFSWPRVSFIMPTLNVEALLDNALSSITRQTYPRDRYEILLADAHSTDRTREIAKKYNAIVLDDDGQNMEEGKRLALQHATGEYIVFVDADNEITHPDYIELAVKALAANPQALGVESYYLPSPKMSSFCAYLTHRLHISDPIAWLMSANPKLVTRDGEVERWILPGDSLSYPLGANGFVFRRADLESVKADAHFQDTHAALHLMREGKREWLRICGRGVYHYYIQTLWGFVQKRRRATVHFLRVQTEAKTNWMKEKPPVPLWLAGIYCVTFAGPLWHAVRGLVHDRDWRWLWHVPASLGSALGDAWGVWTYKWSKHNRNVIAELKPKQTLNLNSRMAKPLQSGVATTSPAPRRIFFIANGLFDNQLAGGDVHLLHSIRAVTEAGWVPEYLSTRELEQHLKAWHLPANVTFTDHGHKQPMTNLSLKGKCRLFWEFFQRFLATLGKLRQIGPEDVCFSPTDYWFDVLPTAFSKAKLKVVIFQMKAPSLKEVIGGSRADVEGSRFASLHYCLSQWLSFKILGFCRQKRVVAVQPLLQATLWQMGYRPEETPLIPNGVDMETANQVGEVTKQFDVAWIGRVHRQKGIEDLLQTLQSLAREFPDFRAVLIGNLKESLAEPIAKLGLTSHVHFAGYVSGVEKFRYLKSARVYLMPSRHEGLPIVVGEALACDLPVVAYELEMYRPFFGNLLLYVKPFDRDNFCRTAVETVRKARAGEKLLNDKDVADFKKANSWQEVGRQLVELLNQTDHRNDTVADTASPIRNA